jgi:hypothetical protein
LVDRGFGHRPVTAGERVGTRERAGEQEEEDDKWVRGVSERERESRRAREAGRLLGRAAGPSARARARTRAV